MVGCGERRGEERGRKREGVSEGEGGDATASTRCASEEKEKRCVMIVVGDMCRGASQTMLRGVWQWG
jgi:hypothetical protein